MKRITLEVSGETESSDGVDVRDAIRDLAAELAQPGMVGGRREIGRLTISWACEAVAEEVKP